MDLKETSKEKMGKVGKNPNFFASVRHALDGIGIILKEEKNMRSHALLGLIPLLFGLPDIGNYLNTLILLIPLLLATSFFGLAASYFFTDSEAPLLMIAFFSVGLIFLSGVSYPLELMPWYWQMAHYIIPAAPATLAYVQLNSMGASIEQVGVEYVTLWVQCVVYFLLACWVYRRNILKASRALSSL